MTTRGAEEEGIFDFTPTHAKDPVMRQKLEDGFKEQLVQEVPEMVSRIAKLELLITLEVDADFKFEAIKAFQHGHWRAVIALVGVVAESLTVSLYAKITSIQLENGTQMSKTELLGDRPSAQSKLAMLRFLGLIEPAHYKKLLKIWRLRTYYVHPQAKPRNAESDALTVMRLLRSVLNERFDQVYTIKKGKIVER